MFYTLNTDTPCYLFDADILIFERVLKEPLVFENTVAVSSSETFNERFCEKTTFCRVNNVRSIRKRYSTGRDDRRYDTMATANYICIVISYRGPIEHLQNYCNCLAVQHNTNKMNFANRIIKGKRAFQCEN